MPSERDSGQRRAAVARDLARAGGRDVRIELVEYDRSWPARFAAEAARLADAAPGLTWHHIGSTAVPGLPAKPIIDMMALVEDVDAAVPALIQPAGYQFPEALQRAPRRTPLAVPPVSRASHAPSAPRRDQVELARHLRFRDALRADAQLAADYAALKRELADRMSDDREGYTAAKTQFIRLVEAKLDHTR